MPPRKGSAMLVLYVVGRVLFALISTLLSRHFTVEGIGDAAELGVPFAALVVPLSGSRRWPGASVWQAGIGHRWERGC